MQNMILFGVLVSTYLMVIAKRTPSLVRSFRYQSFCLFLATLFIAARDRHPELYIVAGLLLALKVVLIPLLLSRLGRKIKVSEDLGLLVNAQLSLLWALVFTYLAWVFAERFIASGSVLQAGMLAVAFFAVLTGMFLMIFRMTALAQIIGLLVMENGLFLLAALVSGGMPFFVEFAIFFDVFVSVVIMGFFVYRINKLFTHIDVRELSRLKG
jgi:hydrogenase-4 component E